MTKKQIPVFKELIKDLKLRDKKGWESYGRPMTTFDGRDTFRDIFEEALDMVVYLKKMELEIEEIVKQFPHLKGIKFDELKGIKKKK